VSPFQEETWLKFSIISRDSGSLLANFLQARKCTRCEMINIHPETGAACPSQPLSLIKRHRDGPPHFGTPANFARAHADVCAGIIAEMEPSSAPDHTITIGVGDLISPCDLAPAPLACAALQGSGTLSFGARSRFWSLESLLQGEAVEERGLRLPCEPLYVVAAACSVAAAYIIWVKRGK
jgi:hypothetical protein